MTQKTDPKKESAIAYARRVIETDFGQKIDDETLNEVAEKIMKAIPARDHEKEPA